MQLSGLTTAVTGGASGLGLATAQRLVAAGGQVTIIDLPSSAGEQVAADLGDAARFVAADVTDSEQFAAALDAAGERGPLRGLVHCAGAGRRLRVLDKDGEPGSLEDFEWVMKLNVTGSFNALRLGAARMARSEAVDGERGAIVLTASVAAFEGQIGQLPLHRVQGRHRRHDPRRRPRPGEQGDPRLHHRARDHGHPAARPGCATTSAPRWRPRCPNPPRLGHTAEFALLAGQILENGYLNGETIRLDGAIRMAPR